jgi:phospholipid-translocating ATPase
VLGYDPTDIDILRSAHKLHPDMDLISEARLEGRLHSMKRRDPTPSVRSSSFASIPSPNPPINAVSSMSASQVDMSTGIRSRHRGFDFAVEEGGVAMRRIQTNLSERRASSRMLAAPPPLEAGLTSPRRKKLMNLLMRKSPVRQERPATS